MINHHRYFFSHKLDYRRKIIKKCNFPFQSGGTFASGGAFITNDQGMVDPSAQVYVNTYSSPNSASSATSVDSRSGFGGAKSTVYASPFTNNDNNR